MASAAANLDGTQVWITVDEQRVKVGTIVGRAVKNVPQWLVHGPAAHGRTSVKMQDNEDAADVEKRLQAMRDRHEEARTPSSSPQHRVGP